MRCASHHCKPPEKRDFMDIHPERTNEDFFRNYDPMIGVGTALILALFILLITIKTFIKWTARKFRSFQYKHCRNNENGDVETASGTVGNGHVNT